MPRRRRTGAVRSGAHPDVGGDPEAFRQLTQASEAPNEMNLRKNQTDEVVQTKTWCLHHELETMRMGKIPTRSNRRATRATTKRTSSNANHTLEQ